MSGGKHFTRTARLTLFLTTAALLLLALTTLIRPINASGPIFVNGAQSLAAPYSQNFDSLLNTGTSNPWANDSTIAGWYSNRTTYIASSGTSNTGGLYSFGTTATTERAIGSLASGSANPVCYGVRFVNDTGAEVTSLDISYTGEQWRDAATTAQTVDFSYQVAASFSDVTSGVYTDVNSLDFTSLQNLAAGAIDGNAAANRLSLSATVALSIPAGQEIMLRWCDPDSTGSDHGLGVDDLTVTVSGGSPTPTPTSAPSCVRFNVQLDGLQETPPNASPATGSGSVEIDTANNLLYYNVSFSGLTGTESAAHIHGFAARGSAAGVLWSLPTGSPKIGSVAYTDAQEANILAGLTYINIHTSAFAGGEIRGQIDGPTSACQGTPTPTPTDTPVPPTPTATPVPSACALRINEVLYQATGDLPEWVEMYVASDVSGLTFFLSDGDSPGLSKAFTLTASAGYYVVVHNDGDPLNDGTIIQNHQYTSVHFYDGNTTSRLSNTGDGVILYEGADATGVACDYIAYEGVAASAPPAGFTWDDNGCTPNNGDTTDVSISLDPNGKASDSGCDWATSGGNSPGDPTINSGTFFPSSQGWSNNSSPLAVTLRGAQAGPNYTWLWALLGAAGFVGALELTWRLRRRHA